MTTSGAATFSWRKSALSVGLNASTRAVRCGRYHCEPDMRYSRCKLILFSAVHGIRVVERMRKRFALRTFSLWGNDGNLKAEKQLDVKNQLFHAYKLYYTSKLRRAGVTLSPD